MTHGLPTRETFRRALATALRVAGVTMAFIVTAAPLPGDTPGCDAPGGGGDETATLAGGDLPITDSDSNVRILCGLRCYADCRLLVGCGRYSVGSGETDCRSECTTARGCTTLTFDALCPNPPFPDAREITQAEEDRCVDISGDQGAVDCWCGAGQDCWAATMPTPIDCTNVGLCDPRE